jgi:hypothetical protein
VIDGKRVGIVQSNYLPWKGYFDLINSVDEFVLLDEVQYTRRDWRNRNRIKTASGTAWLTIPVEVKGKYEQRIDETRIADQTWTRKHWRTLTYSYAAAPFFAEYREQFERLYEECAGVDRLSAVNRRFIELVCRLLRIPTKLSWSTDYSARSGRSERLLDICLQAGASAYVSGPAARDYLDERLFADAGVDVVWMDYEGYPAYPQPHPPFEHRVSCVDLIFSVGPDSPRYMRSFGA